MLIPDYKCYFNITNVISDSVWLPLNSVDHWLSCSSKKPNWAWVRRVRGGGVEAFLFLKSSGFFLFFYFTPENSRQNKAQTKPGHPWRFQLLLLWYPWNFQILTPRPAPHSLLRLVVFLEPIFSIAHLRPASWLPTYLPACQLRPLLRASFAPVVRWNFGMVASSVYITKNFFWFFLLILDEKLTDFMSRTFETWRRKPQLEVE